MPPKDGSSALWDYEAAADSTDPPLQLMSLNHMALGVNDVDSMTK